MNKLTVALVTASLLAFSQAQAAISVTVSGGIGEPLTIQVTGGDAFTGTSNSSDATVLLKFINFWDNSDAASIDNTSSVNTVSLNGSTNPGFSGSASIPSAAITANDLLLGFTNVTSSNGDPITLTTGTRTTGANLSLNYTTSGAVSGNVVVVNASGGALSDTLTYNGFITSVPEPQSTLLLGFATLFGLQRRSRR